MKKFLMLVVIAGFASCNNATKVENEVDSLKNDIDTLTKKIEDSKVVDSIKSKGGVLLDSTKTKGGRLVKSLKEKLKDLKIEKDSIK
jgi:prophage tail gpP-like protein